MTAAQENHPRALMRTRVYDALLIACREAYEQEWMESLWKLVDCDAKAVRYAPVTGRVAYLLECSDREARYHLQAMHTAGNVLRHPEGDARGGAVRWWPVGFWIEIHVCGECGSKINQRVAEKGAQKEQRHGS